MTAVSTGRVTATVELPPGDRPWRRRAARSLALTPAAVAGGWLVLLLLHLALSGRWWWWVLPDLLPPPAYLAVPLAVLAVSAGVTVTRRVRRRPGCRGIRVAAVLAAAGLVLGAGQAGVHPGALLHGPRPVPPGALRVVSWNTQYWHQTDDPARFYAYLSSWHADVYLLQEYLHWVDGGPAPTEDLAGLRRAFPGYHIVVAGELVTVSRFPVRSARPLVPAPAGASWPDRYEAEKVLRTDLAVGGRTLSVYNVHVPVQVPPLRPLSPGFYAAVHQRVEHREVQYGAARADLAANPDPVLVGGDFNTTPAMGELGWLRGHLRDAADAGDGPMPASWPASGPPLWRLDWAFTRGVEPVRYALRDPQGMSDHRLQELSLAPLPAGSGAP